MYLIDDSIQYVPLNKKGIVKDIFEHSDGNMYYSIEVEVEESSDGVYRIPVVKEEELSYNGGYYG